MSANRKPDDGEVIFPSKEELAVDDGTNAGIQAGDIQEAFDHPTDELADGEVDPLTREALRERHEEDSPPITGVHMPM